MISLHDGWILFNNAMPIRMDDDSGDDSHESDFQDGHDCYGGPDSGYHDDDGHDGDGNRQANTSHYANPIFLKTPSSWFL
ncbi:unnamed protein product [Dracunculus medinensis]|uniref:Secreted protein n=1 Tax=Dracunculus medinensis TaxID=318479 RepID=A0A0N4U2T5_DRAME|nr:unnamed protein product [Dracunculus medinensis]